MNGSRKNHPITRRTLLQGLGASIALPLMDVMSGNGSGRLAQAAGDPVGKAGIGKGAAPLRTAYVFVPNGKVMDHWTPKSEGPLGDLPEILQPLEPFKKDFMVLTNLAQNNARPLGDGPGDHARSLACFLTGAHPRKTDGADIRVGVSADQIAAQKIGHLTRFPSLELGIERGAQSGNCDSGYSCAYSSNIAWSSPTSPVAKEINPKQVFDRLFGDGDSVFSQKRSKYHKSILDYVGEDAKRLKGRLGVADQRKLDEYLDSVRQVEQRISRSKPTPPPTGFVKPDGTPDDLKEHIRVMFDLLVIALQGDLTRISTFMLANEGSNRNYAFIGVPDGHHELSHHGKSETKLGKLRKINHFHIEQFAYFLNRLKSVKEGEKTLLDSCMIVYGSGISDGDRHNHNELPVLLAGHGNGRLSPGRHIKYSNDTPLNNLYLTMLDHMGAGVPNFGDSTGRLDKLSIA